MLKRVLIVANRVKIFSDLSELIMGNFIFQFQFHLLLSGGGESSSYFFRVNKSSSYDVIMMSGLSFVTRIVF